MTNRERADAFLGVVALLIRARTELDALQVGDSSQVPNTLKHLLDEPIERTRSYARALYLGGEGGEGAQTPVSGK